MYIFPFLQYYIFHYKYAFLSLKRIYIHFHEDILKFNLIYNFLIFVLMNNLFDNNVHFHNNDLVLHEDILIYIFLHNFLLCLYIYNSLYNNVFHYTYDFLHDHILNYKYFHNLLFYLYNHSLFDNNAEIHNHDLVLHEGMVMHIFLYIHLLFLLNGNLCYNNVFGLCIYVAQYGYILNHILLHNWMKIL